MLFPGTRIMLRKKKAFKDKEDGRAYSLDVPKADGFIV